MRCPDVPAVLAVAFVCACGSFDASPSTADGGGGGGGGSSGDASSGSGFCASRSGADVDVCSDFDDPTKAISTGWDLLNAPKQPPSIDTQDSRSKPASLRWSLDGTSETNLGLTKNIGAGTVYHIEAAVRFEAKVQNRYVDVARIEMETPAGPFKVELDMQPDGLHLSLCPQDETKCVYGNPPYDLSGWKVIAFDLDTTTKVARLSFDGLPFQEATFPAAGVTGMRVTLGPYGVAEGNTLALRYDDILVSHR